MIVDLTRHPSVLGEGVDICVIGAGPAGLVLASELANRGLSIMLLESGGRGREVFFQSLNAGEGGEAYGDLGSTRDRQLGGTIGLWNTEIGGEASAKYVPLDDIDFLPRDWRREDWPFPRSELDPYYQRAQTLACLGPFRYGGGDWRSRSLGPPAWDSDVLTTSVYQFGTAAPYAERARRLEAAENVRLVTHATVVELETDAAASRVTGARVAAPGVGTATVRARRFVLAAGAIENARLLLASNSRRGEGIGNSSGLVGRGFMEHPRDYALTVAPRYPARELAFYDVSRVDGTWIMGRLALCDDMLHAERLPNASVTLLAGQRSGLARRVIERSRSLVGLGPLYPRGGTGWSGHPRLPEFFRLLVNLEQAPDPDNRLRLCDARDALGMPRIQLLWRWTEAEQRDLERLRRLIAAEASRVGLGKVTVDESARPSPRAHHHAGTLRMHDDPGQGVVDRHGRAHDLENVYCTGAAVFPTAGFANPMLTIVALAIRLAEHLATSCRSAQGTEVAGDGRLMKPR